MIMPKLKKKKKKKKTNFYHAPSSNSPSRQVEKQGALFINENPVYKEKTEPCIHVLQ